MGIIECWLILLGLFSVQMHSGGPKEYLSARGTAAQSTTANSLSANHAIDGGKDFSISSSTCTSTHWQSRPWWRLDLQAAYRVNTVVVIYRGDSVPGIMKDIQVKFGNSLLNDGNDNPRCAMISSDSAASSFIYSCSDQEGQYVNIFNSNWWDFLSVCEVEVYESDYSRKSFMKMTFNSTANLTDPTVTDNVLKELKSALAIRGITNVTLSWSQTPQEVVIQNKHENDPC